MQTRVGALCRVSKTPMDNSWIEEFSLGFWDVEVDSPLISTAFWARFPDWLQRCSSSRKFLYTEPKEVGDSGRDFGKSSQSCSAFVGVFSCYHRLWITWKAVRKPEIGIAFLQSLLGLKGHQGPGFGKGVDPKISLWWSAVNGWAASKTTLTSQLKGTYGERKGDLKKEL